MSNRTTHGPLWLGLQVALAGLLAVVVTGALWWGFVRGRAAVAAQGISVEAIFAGEPNGPAPERFDGGQPARVTGTPKDPGARPRILDGRLTYQPTGEETAAGFLSTPNLGAPVRSMGARFVFRPGGGTKGAVAFVVSRGVDSGFPPTIRPLPVHFVLTPVNWNVSLTLDAGDPLNVIATGDFPEPLAEDGATAYEARLTINGAELKLDLPQDVHRSITDPRISEWQGSYASFELFANHGLTDSLPAFEKVWASAAEE
ncbi:MULTISPECIES: hypothetical protein [unclassified Mycolicibacterium]|uniref:hypothetical protein n=1 Tax=unclassified Mycolicibacterium TaxID=2636767 RepID=UPI0012DE7566|nr:MULTISPECIES: hypothetical protein [unclassified Mycolicibacterium]MUL83989.1 hypothetical protein [Mycolicibacterium sp. CBMA 329]MUL89945.1 hypothetical protein [Mycolicibacterium sp. CBMA 331]MUL98034.1 hypothetical protein [Mycolicibacterium sp. CBMA 334]MUM27528.1 hypothetical protein [Mycolicibacterium sp. CBMA 295]MUM39460.1 hypothetical protein [Mycolicibacterium sp. CBMA 247]